LSHPRRTRCARRVVPRGPCPSRRCGRPSEILCCLGPFPCWWCDRSPPACAQSCDTEAGAGLCRGCTDYLCAACCVGADRCGLVCRVCNLLACARCVRGSRCVDAAQPASLRVRLMLLPRCAARLPAALTRRACAGVASRRAARRRRAAAAARSWRAARPRRRQRRRWQALQQQRRRAPAAAAASGAAASAAAGREQEEAALQRRRPRPRAVAAHQQACAAAPAAPPSRLLPRRPRSRPSRASRPPAVLRSGGAEAKPTTPHAPHDRGHAKPAHTSRAVRCAADRFLLFL
jgi:hypothetical protein